VDWLDHFPSSRPVCGVLGPRRSVSAYRQTLLYYRWKDRLGLSLLKGENLWELEQEEWLAFLGACSKGTV
jgi:hypothetical protein